mmetsp:Transcript_8564/g.26904  ORF Transcript_8564/g.26904 Transcript_8564/m.26904 type:complete len:108 (-) Transcript_8564:746-1069(-)
MRVLSLLALIVALVLAVIPVTSAISSKETAGGEITMTGEYIKHIHELESIIESKDAEISELKRRLEAEVKAEEEAHATTKTALQAKLDACRDSLEIQRALAAAREED